MTKWYGPQRASRASHDCLLLHGNDGYSCELPFEERMRDVLALEIADGTVQKIIIARELFGREFVPTTARRGDRPSRSPFSTSAPPRHDRLRTRARLRFGFRRPRCQDGQASRGRRAALPQDERGGVEVSVHVSADNFVRAETDRMFADLQRDAGGVNTFLHNRAPADVDHQTVIRLNRDTLYSFAVVDLADGATLTIPEHGARYLSVMIVNNDHHIYAIYHDAGTYSLSRTEHHTRYVMVGVRILADPTDPADLAAVHAVQDQLELSAGSARPFASPDYDTASLDATRQALLALVAQSNDLSGSFGRPDEVDPVRHLMGTAAGWGGLPRSEAIYIAAAPQQAGNHELTLADVPVDGFWSVSVYDAQGYFEPNPTGRYSVNNITGATNPDGSITVRFGDYPDGTPNALPAPEHWNLLLRLYRPRPAILGGTWQPPGLAPAEAAGAAEPGLS